MTPLKKENLELKFEDNIAFMTVTGLNSPETVDESLDWFKAASEANDNFNLYVDMAKVDFADLSSIGKSFKRVGNVLRMNPTMEKCAVITDSRWIKNSAKVEDAVIPGMNIQPFDLDEKAIAKNWLGGQDESHSVEDSENIIENVAKNTSVLGAPETDLIPKETSDSVSDNPWENFSAKNIDL